jgi:hypothetical protein
MSDQPNHGDAGRVHPDSVAVLKELQRDGELVAE